ncbi:MAG: glutamate--tRNA ligase [Pseudomonadota bacterium]
MTVRVRFAPSPTGFLHIGNARTALFNYLFAKRHNGKFLLRIEDTDKARSTDEATDTIIEGLKWLGLDYDEGLVFQSARLEAHRAAAARLVENGHAYKCYATEDEIQKLRQDAREDNSKIIYPDRDGVRDDIDTDHRDYVIRLKTPLSGERVISDLVQGDVTVAHSELDDFVLLRSDGTPTYMLAVVVDDIDMKITHIIRGDDHLLNAFRQSALYEGLGAKPPQFAHIPLIHGQDGTKLSKRHGALSVTDWRDFGYPAEMICNYLALLGWSMGEQEFFTLDMASKKFDIKDVNRNPSQLDFDKINHMSGVYLRDMPAETLIKRLNQFLYETGQNSYSEDISKILISVADLFKKRAENFKELDQELRFYAYEPEKDEKALSLLSDETNISRLRKLLEKFKALDIWSAETIDTTIKELLTEENIKMGKIGPVIRAAVAGRTSTPDLCPVLAALPKDIALKRIEKSIL